MSFSQELNETHIGEPQVETGSPSLILNPETLDQINIDLYMAMICHFVTPYIAFIKTRRILDAYGINLPSEEFKFLGSEGEITIPVAQYQDPSNPTHYLIFSYVLDDLGYEVYVELLDETGLKEIVS